MACDALQAGSKAAGSSCGADSRVNPVQSVSNSGYFSAAGPGSDGGSWLGAGEDSRLGALGPSAESSYASALPVSAFRCQSVMCWAANSTQPAIPCWWTLLRRQDNTLYGLFLAVFAAVQGRNSRRVTLTSDHCLSRSEIQLRIPRDLHANTVCPAGQ